MIINVTSVAAILSAVENKIDPYVMERFAMLQTGLYNTLIYFIPYYCSMLSIFIYTGDNIDFPYNAHFNVYS